MNALKARDGTAWGHHPKAAQLLLALRIVEPLVFFFSSPFAYVYRHGHWGMPPEYWLMSFFGALVYMLLATLGRSYRPMALLRPLLELPKSYLHLLGSLGAIVLLMFILKISSEFSRTWLFSWITMSMLMVTVLRIWVSVVVRKTRKKGVWALRIAILGTDEKAMEIVRLLAEEERQQELRLVGIYALDEAHIPPDLGKTALFKGTVGRLVSDSKRNMFDALIVTEGLNQASRKGSLLNRLQQLAVDVYYCLPLTLFGRVASSSKVPDIPLQLIFRKPLDAMNLMVKRMLDIAVTLPLLLLLAPLMLLIAAVIRIGSPGPVFFRQKRNGFNGHEFEMLKFRSMVMDAPAVVDGDGKEKQASKDDRRVTAVGRFLRRTSLDELPQLINVLRGDMSLVGPRPHVPSHNSYYGEMIDHYASRHRMKPGITGWAQLNGWRGETDTLDKMAKRVEYDIWYIENWSLLLDLRILFLTPLLVWFQKKAY